MAPAALDERLCVISQDAGSSDTSTQPLSLKRFKLTARGPGRKRRTRTSLETPPKQKHSRSLKPRNGANISPCQVPAAANATYRKCRNAILFQSPGKPEKSQIESGKNTPLTQKKLPKSQISPNQVHGIVLPQAASVEDLSTGFCTPNADDGEQENHITRSNIRDAKQNSPHDHARNEENSAEEDTADEAVAEEEAAGNHLLLEREKRMAMMNSRMCDVLAARDGFAAAAAGARRRTVVRLSPLT